MPSIQPSLRERISRFFRALFAPVAKPTIADLSTCQLIKDAIAQIDVALLQKFLPALAIDRRTMNASFVPETDIVVLKPINDREFCFKIDAKLDVIASHEHLGILASHNLRLAGTILENRKIAWKYAILL